MELLRALQEAEPNIFTPKVAYDGRKIVFSVHPLQFGPTQAQPQKSQKVILFGVGSGFNPHFVV